MGEAQTSKSQKQKEQNCINGWKLNKGEKYWE